ncbi:hypothetical protein [Tenacibaculum soleae]|uniref:hypothetical protein n=1 Tax=Tenacibaculum soleae TaxID=447689 RepID=UPI0023002ED3|nr:hypothetical protein [Tenacibaculum soleae]
MIQVLKAPKEASVFLSKNSLKIEVASTLGLNYYFKVFLYVNGALFDEQGWSKYTPTNCQIELSDMFVKLFNNQFTEVTGNDFYLNASIIKKIEVVIKEYDRVDDTEVNSLNLNYFYVLNSDKINFFDERVPLQKISNLPLEIRVSKNYNLRLPIWVNKQNSNFEVAVVEGNSELFNQTYNTTAIGVYQLDLKLSSLNISSNEIRVIISDGSNTFTQKLLIKNISLYPVSAFYFRNNFGVFESLEIFGSLKESNKYTRKTYALPTDSLHLSNTSHVKSFKINTGFLLPEELIELEVLNNSKEIYFNYKSQLIPVIPVSKKSKGRNYEEDYDDDFVEFQVNDTNQINDQFKYD